MNVYMPETFHEGYRSMLEDVLEFGDTVSPRGQKTTELRDVTLILGPGRDDGKAWGRTNDRYVLAEMAWYLSRDPSTAFIKQHAALWGRIENPDGTANSNYGEKLWGELPCARFDVDAHSEWDWCRSVLAEDPSSRQAVAVINRPEHHWLGNKDVPCTLNLSWMVRDGRLETRAHMRSSDAWFGLPYDVPFFDWLSRRMLSELQVEGLELKMGSLRVQLDSFHLYEQRAKHARDYLARWKPAPRWLNPVPYWGGLDELALLAKTLLEDMPAEEVLA